MPMPVKFMQSDFEQKFAARLDGIPQGYTILTSPYQGFATDLVQVRVWRSWDS